MQTQIAPQFAAIGQEAESILRKCVHCGFCLATCPTYQLLGDELDSPRGRIYLIKQVLEGAPVTERTQLHLDRCLTCRSCESTCPSGVQYGRLVDIGRQVVDAQVPRSVSARAQRYVLKKLLPQTGLFKLGLAAGRIAKPLLPGVLGKKILPIRPSKAWPAVRHARQVLVIGGCVQPAMAPSIDAAFARVLDQLGVSAIAHAGCCGAVEHHLNDHEASLQRVRNNIDQWWPRVEAGIEAIVMTASGCGAMLAEYGHLLRDDPAYASKALRISELFRDTAQVISGLALPLKARLSALAPVPVGQAKVAFHPPCTLQHGLKIRGVTEAMLADAGFTLTSVRDAHLCCGSAGTYSILQSKLSGELLGNKLSAIAEGAPDQVCSANIGCLAHLESGMVGHEQLAKTPIRHWIELLEERLS